MAARPPCQYGDRCYRTNPAHIANFTHPRDSQLTKTQSTPTSHPPTSSHPSHPPPTSSSSAKRTASELPAPPRATKRSKGEEEKAHAPTPSPARHDAPQSDEEDDASLPYQSLSSLNRLSLKARTGHYRELLKALYGLDFPPDFYSFFLFLLANHRERDGCDECTAEALHPGCAAQALVVVAPSATLPGVSCCGLYDWLAGAFDGVPLKRVKPWLHWRFFYDLPQLMTVYRAVASDDEVKREAHGALKGEGDWHCGYWRDAPDDAPPFLVACPNTRPDYTVQGATVYHAMHRHLLHLRNLASKGPLASPAAAATLDATLTRLLAHAEAQGVTVVTPAGAPQPSLKDAAYLERKRRVLAPTLTGLGFVCPYDDKTEVGFRPLPITGKALHAMLARMQREEDGGGAVDYTEWDGVQTLLTLAMDECDPGTVQLFCQEVFSSLPPQGARVVEGEVSQGMRRAWELMGGREQWRRCIAQHLKYRYRLTLDQAQVAARHTS